MTRGQFRPGCEVDHRERGCVALTGREAALVECAASDAHVCAGVDVPQAVDRKVPELRTERVEVGEAHSRADHSAAVRREVMGAFGGQAAITQMGIDRTSGNVRVHWVGTGEPIELYALGGPSGEVLDLTQAVTGDEAWIPLGALVIDDSTCLVVRPAAPDAAEPTADGKPAPRVEVTDDAGALAEQRGAIICVADAVDLALPDADEDE